MRISGPAARDIGRALLDGKPDLVPRHATLARVCDSGGRLVDEVIATAFAAPQSYTAEDIVEIAAHGSPALLREIVRTAVLAGARLAEPGEFTLRAFLNGRLDLVQAEAVADLVDAVTPLQARVAFDQLEGTLTEAIGKLDGVLFDLAARLEASVDFPDEAYQFVSPGEVAVTLRRVWEGVGRLIESAGRGRMIREGRQVAIVGKPNVGKSSVFNWLVGSERAIVSDIPGTTRDLVTESIDFEGILLCVVDTAGICDGGDGVGREGVARARRAARVADVVLLVCDPSRPFDEEDVGLVAETAGCRRVVVFNKADLVGDPEWSALGLFSSFRRACEGSGSDGVLRAEGRLRGGGGPNSVDPVVVSIKTGAGLDELRLALRLTLECEGVESRELATVTNVRHEELLRVAGESLTRAIAGLERVGEEVREELVLADIVEARGAFEEVTGRRTTNDVLERIFSRFCVGK